MKRNFSKRIFDVLLIVAFSWLVTFLFLFAALTVLLFDGRPIFFRQQRVGKGGVEFLLIKFRTMRACKGSEHGSFDAGSSSRVTKIGKFLRRTKLDELPQLWNVLCGHMSLVGPRPEVRKWVDIYPERWSRIHQVPPGITDPASIVYRNEEQVLAQSSDPENTYKYEVLPHKLYLYEKYVSEQSLFSDLMIIFNTIKALFE